MYTSYLKYNRHKYTPSISPDKRAKFASFYDKNNPTPSEAQINSEEIKIVLSEESKESSDDTLNFNIEENSTENLFDEGQTKKKEDSINPDLKSTVDNNSLNENLPVQKHELFKITINKERGKLKNPYSKTFLKKKHKSSSFDNILTKIQVHFINFLINLVNDIVKTEFPMVNAFFRDINYQAKKKIDHKYLSYIFQSSIKYIITTNISLKYKKYESNINQSLYNHLAKTSKWFKDFLEMKYINAFNLYYYNKEKALNTVYIQGKAITVSPKTKSFYYLLKKNEGLAQAMKNTVKTVYLNEYNKENPFTTIKKDK